MNKILKAFATSTTVSLIFAVSACSAVNNLTNQGTQNQYRYAHECTLQGKPVTRFITASVPLASDDVTSLRQSLEENYQLDHQSCIYII